MKGKIIDYFSENGQDKGIIYSKRKMTIIQKYIEKEMRVSILVRYIIGRETRLYGFGGLAVSYLSDIHFEQLSAGDTAEFRLGLIFFTW